MITIRFTRFTRIRSHVKLITRRHHRDYSHSHRTRINLARCAIKLFHTDSHRLARANCAGSLGRWLIIASHCLSLRWSSRWCGGNPGEIFRPWFRHDARRRRASLTAALRRPALIHDSSRSRKILINDHVLYVHTYIHVCVCVNFRTQSGHVTGSSSIYQHVQVIVAATVRIAPVKNGCFKKE